MADMLEGMWGEINEIVKIGGGLALLHSMLITDGRYTGSCFTVWDNARKALNEVAATLAAKDKEIAGLKVKFNVQVAPELRAAEIRGMLRAAEIAEKAREDGDAWLDMRMVAARAIRDEIKNLEEGE